MDEGISRGRGRGRGAGVPLLPSGVWDELNRSKPTSTITTNSNQKQFTSAEEDSGGDVSQTVDRVEVGAFHDQPSVYLNGPDSNGVIAEAAVANTNDGNTSAVAPTANALEMLPGMDAYGGYTNGTVINARGGFGRGRGGRGGRGMMMSGGRGVLKRDVKGPDWDCPSCTNVNWSWRSNCNKCNTAKPVSILSENEVRDGAGGGFNERQERVSAATVEVGEDGFDDFGRRAKNGNGNNSSGQYRQVVDHSAKERKEKAALERLKAAYGFLLPQSMDSSSNNNNGMDISTSSGQYQDSEDTDNKSSNSNGGSSSSSSSRHKNDDRDRNNKDNNNSSSTKHRSAISDGRSDRENKDNREKDRDRNERDRDRERERGREREYSDRGGIGSSNNRNDIRGSNERGSDRNTTSSNHHRDRSRDRDRDRNSRR